MRGRIAEEICIGLLDKYQAEKAELTKSINELEQDAEKIRQGVSDVDEFIRRLKYYVTVPDLTREMCLELIEFVTVDKCPGKGSNVPREIHIYYKLLDKGAGQKQKDLWKDCNVCADC